MAVLLDYQGRKIPLPTEGGHAGFSPFTEREYAVKKVLQSELGFVSNETLLSGSGLILLYNTLSMIDGTKAPAYKIQELASEGLSVKDPLAIETFHMFFEILGSVAGDYVLQTGAKGGVYIGGGIAPRYLEFIAESKLDNVESKGRQL